MKKLLLLPLLLLFCLVFPPKVALADEATSGTQSATPTQAPVVSQYTLPYPGILPDNPLYFIKVARDTIVGFFIADPLRKATFYLLQSDKRIAASWYLEKEPKRNEALILTTLSKSTNYMDQAIGSLRTARQTGESVSGLASTIQEALVKHRDVIADMMMVSGSEQKKSLAQEDKRLVDLEQEVAQFIQR